MQRTGGHIFFLNTDPPLDGMLSGSELLHTPCDHCGMLIRNMPCAILLSCLSNL